MSTDIAPDADTEFGPQLEAQAWSDDQPATELAPAVQESHSWVSVWMVVAVIVAVITSAVLGVVLMGSHGRAVPPPPDQKPVPGTTHPIGAFRGS